MDAPVRRLMTALALGTPLLAGCSLFDRDTDRLVQSELRSKSPLPTPTRTPPVPAFDTPNVSRGQAPGGPVVPGGPLPPAPLGPGPIVPPSTTPPAPVSPLPPDADPTRAETAPPPPSAAPPGAPTTRVKLVATVGPEYFVTEEEVGMMVRQRARDYIP